MITPDIANYIYTFVLVFAVCQFALNLVMQQATGTARGATSAMMNPNVIAGALAFGSAFFVYMSGFDMILFTIPWIMFITFGLLFAMVYRVVQLFGGGGGGPVWYRPFGIGISLIILSFFVQAIFQYVKVYQEESGTEALTGFAGSFFGLFNSLTGWMLLAGIGFIIYALAQAIGEAGGVGNLLTGNPPTPTPPGPNDPTAAFTAVATTAVVGDAITFTNTSAPSTGHTITEWYWDFDDGTSETVTVAPGDPTVPKSYITDRTFNVTLRVTDDGGGSPNTATIPIIINPATPPGFPTARYSVNGGAPLIQVGTVIFDAGISTDNAGNDHTHGNLEFHWNFGGAGGRAAGEAPGTSPMGLESVVYVTPGTYTVMLRVHDTASGNDDNHTINFTVEPLTPPPPP
jgi:PKD repeat protein